VHAAGVGDAVAGDADRAELVQRVGGRRGRQPRVEREQR
jgi:hypothetical protein